MIFKDHFSDRASGYASNRPAYPIELATFLAARAPSRRLAWDCGCGSGQMSVPLSSAFERVIATDASAEQIAHATPRANVEYRVAPAEQSGIADSSADLIVVAQAAHWFDLPRFYDEVRRVAKNGAIVALITYDLLECEPQVDAVIERFYAAVGRYWPQERRMVEDGYASLHFPFDEIAAPPISMHAQWTLAQLIGYIETWSAVRAMQNAEGSDRLVEFERDLRTAWGDETQTKPVRWPLSMRIGRSFSVHPER